MTVSEKPRVKISKWFIDDNRLFGFVKSHPKINPNNFSTNVEGEMFIQTGKIKALDLGKKVAETANTIYFLGEEQLPFLGFDS